MSAAARPAARRARSASDTTPTIDIAWRLRKTWHAEPLLRRAARAACAAEGLVRGTISVAVVGARSMAKLHEQYHGTAGPTDVLTFDLGSDARSGLVEAEIVVCAAVARRQARRYRGAARRGPAASRELALYVVHGVLHLAGYDDHSATAARRMHAREDEILIACGIGAVFAP